MQVGTVLAIKTLADRFEPPAGMFAPLLGTPDDFLAALEPMPKDSDCTHFSFAFRSSGGILAEVARAAIERLAKEVLSCSAGGASRRPATRRTNDL